MWVYQESSDNMEFSDNFDTIFGENITLKIIDKNKGGTNELPYYYYNIYFADQVTLIGKISVRIGHFCPFLTWHLY